MFKPKITALGAAAVIAGAALAVPFTTAAKAEWEPQKPVQLIIMAGAGAGGDQAARVLQRLIAKKGLSPRPFLPISKPGGSGAEALRYMQSKAGDDHTLMVTLNSFYTAPIIQENLGVDVSKFTPIGRVAVDIFLLWVHMESGVYDLESYVASVKGSDQKWKVGGTGPGEEDSILAAMLEAEFGYEAAYIQFPGGGSAAKNLVDKHIDSTINNPSAQNSYYLAAQTQPLVQFTPERTDAYPDIPTARELGHDIVYFAQRSVNGPPDMSKEAQEWYINLFETLFNSDEWQAFCKGYGLTCDEWIAGSDLAALHAEQIKLHKDLISKIGAAAIMNK
ncbi:MAG: Bug family tripartite tricarboxylate transporter substrate binding protein [Rhodospirillales bacterium]